MSGPKHTPGPWGYERSEAQNAWEVAPKDAEGRLDWAREVCITADENEANVRLIVAAPRLAKALRLTLAALISSPEGELLATYGAITDRLLGVQAAIDDARAALREAGMTDDA